jgi:hypothetical protein
VLIAEQVRLRWVAVVCATVLGSLSWLKFGFARAAMLGNKAVGFLSLGPGRVDWRLGLLRTSSSSPIAKQQPKPGRSFAHAHARVTSLAHAHSCACYYSQFCAIARTSAPVQRQLWRARYRLVHRRRHRPPRCGERLAQVSAELRSISRPRAPSLKERSPALLAPGPSLLVMRTNHQICLSCSHPAARRPPFSM